MGARKKTTCGEIDNPTGCPARGTAVERAVIGRVFVEVGAKQRGLC